MRLPLGHTETALLPALHNLSSWNNNLQITNYAFRTIKGHVSFCVSHCEKIPEIILKEGNICFGSSFQRFQFMATWPVALGL
jgi:hypothetical protein